MLIIINMLIKTEHWKLLSVFQILKANLGIT